MYIVIPVITKHYRSILLSNMKRIVIHLLAMMTAITKMPYN